MCRIFRYVQGTLNVLSYSSQLSDLISHLTYSTLVLFYFPLPLNICHVGPLAVVRQPDETFSTHTGLWKRGRTFQIAVRGEASHALELNKSAPTDYERLQ